jgi:hypothetical protein
MTIGKFASKDAKTFTFKNFYHYELCGSATLRENNRSQRRRVAKYKMYLAFAPTFFIVVIQNLFATLKLIVLLQDGNKQTEKNRKRAPKRLGRHPSRRSEKKWNPKFGDFCF